MPHGKQSNRRQNAKKNGRDNRSTTTTSPQSKSTSEPRPLSQRNISKKDMDQFMKSVQESFEETFETDLPSLDPVQDSLYARYKKCTQRFKDTLQSLVPAEIFSCGSASALMTAAEYVAQNDEIQVERQLLDDLKVAIRVRKRVAVDQFAGGDKGHSYFIAVLSYCWSILAPKLPQQIQRPKQPKTNVNSIRNRFQGLSMDEEDNPDDKEDDLERDLPSSPIARPEQAETSRLSLEELISGSDRMSAVLFLMTLDELMGCVSNHYSKLKEASARIQKEEHPPGIIIEQMMEAAFATNLAIQQVASLEESFVQDYPHLNTVYRVLACLQLVDLVPIVTRIVSEKSPLAAQFSEKDAVEFLGDAMECAVRNASDPRNRQRTLVKEFLERWQFSDDIPVIGRQQGSSPSIIDEKAVSRIFEYVCMLVRIEVPLHQELQISEILKLASGYGMSSHKWLNYLAFLGQDRSIVHTVRLLQNLSNVIKNQRGVLLPLGTSIFGPSWKTRQAAATKIQVEMDSLLMEGIMPSLVNMCHNGLLSCNLPFHEELLTAFAQIKMFVQDPEPPVTWSLAFTVHSILTSVFDVQGSYHPYFLSQVSRLTYELYFQQLVRAKRTYPTSFTQRMPSWDKDIESLLHLQFLPFSTHCGLESHDVLAIWNPFCSGMFLCYIAYYLNLHKGTKFVDAVAQLRMTLHLFNALRQIDAIPSGQVVPLDLIFQIFKDCKSVWEGPLPTQGQFQTRWLISCGTQQGKPSPTTGRNDVSRTSTPIVPEVLSNSFRRICRRDFTDTGDMTSCAGDGTSSVITMHAARVDGTWNAMQCDEQLLGTNLIALGYYLHEFYFKFFLDLGLMSNVEQLIRQGTRPPQANDERLKYHCMSLAFANCVLGPLDNGDTLVASKCAKLLLRYFNGLSPEKVMWFTPITDVPPS